MRQLGLVATVFTLVAVFVGVMTLSAFGFSWWEVVKILVPMGLGVAAVSWLIFFLGVRSARWLNRDHQDGEESTGPSPDIDE